MSQTAAQRHSEALAWANASWSSIDLRITHAIRGSSAGRDKPPDFDRILIEYTETAAGWRLLRETYVHSGKGQDVALSVCSFDGERGMDSYQNLVREQPQQVVVNKHFSREDRIGETIRPRPLYYQWVGRKPLHEALPDARYLGEVREEGRPCDAFLFLKAGYTGEQDRVYFLDKQTSLPVKVVTYLDSEARAQDRPLTVWQPTEIRQVQGYPVVWSSTERDYTGDGGTLAHTREYRVESVAFNRNHSREDFRVQIEPNALVIDTTGKEMVQQPSAPVTSAQQSTQVMTPAPAIRAEPDRAWFDLAAPFSAGTGLILIAIGFWLSRRRP